MKIRNVMARDVQVCAEGETAREALARMWEHDVGALAVVREGTVIGFVTDRDIAMATLLRDRHPGRILIGEIISGRVAFVTPEQTIEEAAEALEDLRIRRLPVVEDGRLVGMVTLADLARSELPASRVQRIVRTVTEPRLRPSAAATASPEAGAEPRPA